MRDIDLQDRTYLYPISSFGSFNTGFSMGLKPEVVEGINGFDLEDGGQTHVLRLAQGGVALQRGGWAAIEIRGGEWSVVGQGGAGDMQPVPRQRQRITFSKLMEGQRIETTLSIDGVVAMADSLSGTRYLTCEDGRRYLIANVPRTITVELTPTAAAAGPKP